MLVRLADRWRVTDAPGGNHSQAMIGYEMKIQAWLWL
eukprot:SAG31_NODE_16638_length_701_cov_2.445183_2_plen_36_part_01